MEMHGAVGSRLDLGLVGGKLGASNVEVQGGSIEGHARGSWGPRVRSSGEGHPREVTPIEHPLDVLRAVGRRGGVRPSTTADNSARATHHR
jgi:hypothetical protein